MIQRKPGSMWWLCVVETLDHNPAATLFSKGRGFTEDHDFRAPCDSPCDQSFWLRENGPPYRCHCRSLFFPWHTKTLEKDRAGALHYGGLKVMCNGMSYVNSGELWHWLVAGGSEVARTLRWPVVLSGEHQIKSNCMCHLLLKQQV